MADSDPVLSPTSQQRSILLQLSVCGTIALLPLVVCSESELSIGNWKSSKIDATFHVENGSLLISRGCHLVTHSLLHVTVYDTVGQLRQCKIRTRKSIPDRARVGDVHTPQVQPALLASRGIPQSGLHSVHVFAGWWWSTPH